MLIILLPLAFNGMLSLIQEARAKDAVAALRQNLALMASVRRGGAWTHIAASSLVGRWPASVPRRRLMQINYVDVAII